MDEIKAVTQKNKLKVKPISLKRLIELINLKRFTKTIR